MSFLRITLSMGLLAMIALAAGCAATEDPDPDPNTEAVIVNHTSISLNAIPSTYIDQAKQKLHIAYGHTSHGSQLTTGMAGLVTLAGAQYAFNSGGRAGPSICAR